MPQSTRLIPLTDGARPIALVPGERYVIGRGTAADVVLDHASVSRQHALLERDRDGRWVLYDLGSHNGTRVNDEPVRDRPLADGDRIRVGAIELAFEEAAPVSAGPAMSRSLLDSPADDGLAEPDVAPLDLRARTSKLSSEHVSAILAFGRALEEADDRSARLERLLDLAISADLGGRWAYALRISRADSAPARDPNDEVAIVLLAPPRTHPTAVDDEPHISRSALRAVLRDRGPVVASRATNTGARFEAELTAMPHARVTSAIACPIATHPDGSIDVLYVILPPDLAGVEWLMLFSLAIEQFRHAESLWVIRQSAAVRAAYEREMSLARAIQSRTLPGKSSLQAIDWATRFEPSLAVAGDYVDAWKRDDGSIALVIADVSGKGMQAALVAAALHAAFHAGGRAMPLVELIDSANEYLCAVLPGTSFVTLAALTFDPRNGEAVSVNCGHFPFLAIDSAGGARPLPGGDNLPLGVAREPIRAKAVRIAPGEWIVGYTDGLTELRNEGGEMLGPAATVELIQACCHGAASAEAAAARIFDGIDAYRGDAPAGDDRTLLVARASAG